MIRVLIVDDHALIRAGLSAILSQSADLTVTGQCTDGAEVAATIPSARPDVVLMDVQMRHVGGTAATRHLLSLQPNARVIMLSGSIAPRTLAAAASAGAVGYRLKGESPDDLVAAIHTVAAGGTAWPGDPLATSTATG